MSTEKTPSVLHRYPKPSDYSDIFGGVVAMALMVLFIYEFLDVVERSACAKL